MSKAKPLIYSMPDSERSAFGLGWEYRRRGKSIDLNPFDRDSRKWRQFRDGFAEFIPSKLANYNADNLQLAK